MSGKARSKGAVMAKAGSMWGKLMLSALLAASGVALPAVAQEAASTEMPRTLPAARPAAMPATLLADEIRVTPGNVLTASGAVEVYYQGNRLTAQSLRYDSARETLEITGPLRLTEPQASGAILLADEGALSADLREGILRGARLVLARELQLAATQIERREGRYTVLDRVVASSCQICASNPRPLWEVRARRVTHDAQTRQIHYEGAQMRAFGLPFAYLPKLRTPDPTVERMSGVLAPELRYTSSLGMGLKLPYFWTLGESRDLTITPYLAAKNARSVDLRLRQAYESGTMLWQGALSRDQILAGEDRFYLYGTGSFSLPRGYQLGFQAEAVSDDGYLSDYGLSEKDRLWSGLTLSRVKADRLVSGRLGYAQSLREDDQTSTEPALAGDLEGRRIYTRYGGEAELRWSLHGLRRASELDGDQGRDLTRSSVSLGWQRNWLLGQAMLATVEGQVIADAYRVSQDTRFAAKIGRVAPSFATTLRLPLVRQAGVGSDLLEPFVQAVWARKNLDPVPNDDSLLLEFDEGNLLSLSRYPGEDLRERGLRATLGTSWTRHDASGASFGVTVGRVMRADDLYQFASSSGLSGTRSDWLSTAHFSSGKGLFISNRALTDDTGALSREELRLAWQKGARSLALGYLWMEADPVESRNVATSELLMQTQWPMTPNWDGSFSARYDFTADSAAKAGFAARYTNECVTSEISLSRRFTSSATVAAETSVGLSVELAGFGGKAKRMAGQCG